MQFVDTVCQKPTLSAHCGRCLHVADTHHCLDGKVPKVP